jgi:hypothetical protein
MSKRIPYRRLYELYAKHNNQPVNEVDFQKFQQKFGSSLSKLGKSISSPTVSKFGQKMSMNKLPYNVGAKLDKTFNTQGYQDRKSRVQKYNNSNKVVENLKRLISMWNATMDIKYKTVNPRTIEDFSKDLDQLVQKYINKL